MVSFDTNDGNERIQTQYINCENNLVYPLIPTKDGYVFAGWYDNFECTGNPFDFSQNITKDVRLYAKWLLNKGNYVLKLNENQNVNVNTGDFTYYAFVPLTSGTIKYETISYTHGYTVNLCDSNKNTIGWSNQLSGTYNVEAGTLYYIRFKSDSSKEFVNTIKLSIALPAAGGSSDAPIDFHIEIAYGSSYQLPIYEKDGYHFVGWFEGEGGTGTQYTNGLGESLANWNMLEGNTLYPAWEVVTVTVSYDVAGGEALADQSATYNALITHPTPVREGYNFLGWYLGEELITSGIWYGLADSTLVAHWEATEYTITYNLAGGTKNELDPDSYTILDETITLHVPTREGYTFLGWDNAGEITQGSTGNKTFTATWQAISSTITFDVNGGVDLVVDTFNVTYDKNAILPTTERLGYTFLGWFNGDIQVKDGIYKYYEDITLVAHWEVTAYTITYELSGGTKNELDPLTYTMFDETITLHEPEKYGYTFLGWDNEGTITQGSTGNKTFTATWQAIESIITFDVNEGDALAEDTMNVSYDMNVLLPTPERFGYTFAGWYNGKIKVESGIYHKLEDVTLVAHWIATEYTITYELSGGAKNPLDPVTYTMLDETITLHEPRRFGYTFVAWDNEGTITQGSTGNKTFTATWVAISSTITLDVNGGDALVEDTLNATYDADITLPTPERLGYIFLGWYDDVIKVESGIYHKVEDVTLVAHWEVTVYTITLDDIEASYTVSFESNGGSSIPSQQINNTSSLAYPTIPTKEGYIFSGWFDNEECSGNPYDFSKGIISDLVLYARWNTYSNKATPIVLGENTINIIGGSTTQFFAFVPLVSGTITINVGKEAYIGCSDKNPSDSTYSNSGYTQRVVEVTAGVTYYISLQSCRCNTSATYTGSTYLNIVSEPIQDGANVGIDSYKYFEVEYGSLPTYTIPTVAEGYVFMGWYDGVGGTGNQITDSLGQVLAPWNITSDITLYAKIEAIE